MGIANPTGLRSKATYVVEHMAHGDMWAFSETHLNSREVGSFNSGLRFAESDFQPLLGGCPVPQSPDNTGSWKGVGVLSKTPVRHIPNSWPVGVWKSSRAMAFTSLVDDVWMTGGIVYGEPESQQYPARLVHNEALLQAVTASVGFLSSGPRFIAGDWNVAYGELPVFSTLESLGFRDLQDVAQERWGVSPFPTCKMKTRKDFCFISPELQQLLLKVEVCADVWPDHAIVTGTFQRVKCCVSREVWRMPGEFPWPKEWQVDSSYWRCSQGELDSRYASLWNHIEVNAAQGVPFSVPRQSFGRASTTSTSTAQTGKFSPVRVGRRGDFQPQFFGCSFRHAQWIRQSRRLQSYVRSFGTDSHVTQYGTQVWAAILRAPGFVGGFSNWWLECDRKVHGAPVFIPWIPPGRAMAQSIFETVVIHVRLLEN